MKKLRIRNRKVENGSLSEAIRINWLTHLFGCWHKRMGTPFTRGGQTYCACRECGACRKFDMVRWKSVGSYYYNPILALYDVPLIVKKNIDYTGVTFLELDRWTEDGGQNLKENGENCK